MSKEILDQVQELVYSNFNYRTDKRQYRMEEHWVMPESDYDGTSKIVGDCEEFALACRKLLREHGIATRLVYCIAWGEGHCCLESEGWILDNNFDRVMTNDELTRDHGYEFIAVSGYEPGDPWYKIA